MKASEVSKEAKLAEWANDIKARKDAGMTIEQWCEFKEISLSTYRYRYRKVMSAAGDRIEEKKKDNQLAPVAFAPVTERAQDILAADVVVPSAASICFRFGNKTLELPQTVPEEYFRMALEVFVDA